MPDIRDVLKGLTPEDAQLYAQVRTDMRRSYMACHAATLRLDEWTLQDDSVLDLIDIQVATLFVRSGRFDHKQTPDDKQGGVVDEAKAAELEAQIKAEAEARIAAIREPTKSQQLLADIAANAKATTGWPTGNASNSLNGAANV